MIVVASALVTRGPESSFWLGWSPGVHAESIDDITTTIARMRQLRFGNEIPRILCGGIWAGVDPAKMEGLAARSNKLHLDA